MQTLLRLAGSAEGVTGHIRAVTGFRARAVWTRARGINRELLVVVGSASVTVAFIVLPSLRLGYRAPALHVAVETAAALIALLAAFLVFGRLRRGARVPDLLLACGLGTVAVSNFWFRAVPTVVGDGGDRVIAWAAVGGRLAGALLLAAAASAPSRRLPDPGRAAVKGALISAGVVAAAAASAWLFRLELPRPVLPSDVVNLSPQHPDLTVGTAFTVIQGISALLYGFAAWGFAQRAMRRNDDFLRWLGLACVLGAFSRLNYFLYPSGYTDWVYLGDIFRLGFFALLLAAAMREIAAYWRTVADAASLNERRHLARDLHDGLAQELAYLRRNIPALETDGDDPDLRHRLAAATERAERESRQLLAALAAPTAGTFDVLLAEALGEVAARELVRVDLDLASGVRLDHARAEALLRIAAEAVTNAARHAGVDEVRVRLEQLGSHVRLRVSDDGAGFDPGAAGRRANGGFGLISMNGRAQAIGGSLSLSSRPDVGTTVEVIA